MILKESCCSLNVTRVLGPFVPLFPSSTSEVQGTPGCWAEEVERTVREDKMNLEVRANDFWFVRDPRPPTSPISGVVRSTGETHCLCPAHSPIHRSQQQELRQGELQGGDRKRRSGRDRTVCKGLPAERRRENRGKVKILDSGAVFFRSGSIFAAIRGLAYAPGSWSETSPSIPSTKSLTESTVICRCKGNTLKIISQS